MIMMCDERDDRRRVDGFRHDDVADESRRVEERDEEHEIADDAVGEDQGAMEARCFHGGGSEGGGYFAKRWVA